MKTKLYNYLYNTGVPINEVYTPLLALANKFASPSSNNFWQTIITVSDYMKARYQTEQWYPEKIIFGLVEWKTASDLAASLEAIDRLLARSGVSLVDNTKTRGKFIGLELNDATLKHWASAYDLADSVVKNRVDSELPIALSLFARLNIQFQTVGMLINLPLGPALYSKAEVNNFVNVGGADCDFARLVFTLREMSITDARHEVYVIVKEFLLADHCLNNENLEWEQAVLLVWSLGFMFNEFERLSSEDQIWLINNYYYRAFAIGVPLKIILQSYLLSSRWVVEYVRKCSALILNIENNSENVYFGGEENNSAFGLISAEYHRRLADKISEGLSDQTVAEAFVAGLFGGGYDESAPTYYHWLQEALIVYVGLKESTLVDWLKDGDSPLNYENRGELIKLLTYFVYGGEFVKLVEYFQDKKSKVPFKIFLNYIKDAVDLSVDVIIQNCLAFAEVMRDNGLLSSDDDLIEYHQEDGQFYWNKKLLKQ